MSDAVYTLRDVRFGYHAAKPILRDFNLSIAGGDFVGIIGPNGAGKSTLLHLLSGLRVPNAGTIDFLGRSFAGWSRRDIARHVAVVPQREESSFAFTVEEVVLMGRFAHHPGTFGFDDDADREIARQAIADVDLRGFEERNANELSGGERQRLLVARALAQQTPVLLLDEPTASLDLGHQRMLFMLLEKLNSERGLTIIAVSHDINLAAMYCRELLLISEGRILRRGVPAEVLEVELLSQCYGAPLSVTRSEDGSPFLMIRR